MHPGYTIGEVYLYRDLVDFRKSIHGLSALVEMEPGLQLFSQTLFVFTNRRRDKLKVLYWHRNGFCLWLKRLEKDRFPWWQPDGNSSCTIRSEELEWLLDGIDIWKIKPHKSLNYMSYT